MCTQEITNAINCLVAKKLKEIARHTHKINDLENVADDLLRDSLKTLFSTSNDPIEIIKRKEITVELFLDDNLPNVAADEKQLQQVFINLVQNSLRYTTKGGITIKSKLIQKEAFIEVSDTGKGMNETQMKNLFLRFRTRTDTSEDGTGIGLAIAKTIADFHKIEISVISEVDKGTVFSFIFPEIS